MKPQRLIVVVLALTALALGAVLFLAPRFSKPKVLTGYVEGEALYLASPVSGTLSRLAVRRGDQAAAGQVLFTIDPRQLSAQQKQAAEELSAAQAQAVDARKGQRPSEIAAFDAETAAARASLRDAEATYRRVGYLEARGIYARARLDDARSARDAAAANVKAALERRATATLGAREDQIRAADARVRQAQANLAGAGARLSDLSPAAPSAARVEDVFYQIGEWVAANQPVVSLLPADRIRVRFFAPEKEVALYRLGRTISFACDSCPTGMAAKISFVSPRPEYTPPVIYSLGARDRLVFMIEAMPAHPERLTPGLPVDVTPLKPERGR
jgi:HlyD family secretion protein